MIIQTLETRPIVIFGKTCDQYYITDSGTVYNKKGYIMKACISTGGKREHLKINLTFPKNMFKYSYSSRRCGDNTVRFDRYVHQLVMETYRPIYQYPPNRLKHIWNSIPEEAKKWIAETVTIDHKDGDPKNNHVDNLEYVTQKENSHRAVKFYNGNCANKNKKKIQVIIRDYKPKITIDDFL